MTEAPLQPSVDVLLVEDNSDDVFLIRTVLERSGLRKNLHTVETGEDALCFLRRESPYEEAPRPHLILLDLFLPDISGLDVLQAMRQDPRLRPIPVIILTVSGDTADMLAAYDEHARAFITKPGNRAEFEEAVERLEAFWLETAQLPSA